MILETLKELAEKKARGMIVTDVRIGLCYTAVLLDNGTAGVALTFRKEIPPGCSKAAKPLAGQAALDIIKGITSADLLERTVGIAAANALLNEERDGLIEGDTLKLLSPAEKDIVGMVGYFGPLVPILKNRVKELRIFERVPEKSLNIYPEEEAFEFLPSCSIALITSTTLINRTAENLLDAARNCQKVALVGSSTPLVKEVFSDFKVDVLSGVLIPDPRTVLRIVSEGAGMKAFKGHIRKVNILCKQSANSNQSTAFTVE